MNTQVTPEFSPHVAVINGVIKTNSIIVAEHFGKRHDNVVRDIEKLEIPDAFRFLNFEESSFETEMPNGGKRKHKSYEMTKDGFMFLAMGFTGKEAAQWKIAYINAFNAMAEQIAQPQNALKQLPEPKTKKALPGGLTLDMQDAIKQIVKERIEQLPKERQAGGAICCWSAIKKKYGKTYKAVEPEHFSAIVSLLARLPLQGELLDSTTPSNALTINLDKNAPLKQLTLKFETTGFSFERWTVSNSYGTVIIQPMPDDALCLTEAEWIKYMTQERGYVVGKKL